MPNVTTLTLNNGVTMPALGLGVFQTPPEETRDAVTAALEAGYRHIDTAAAYGNERQVGEAIAASGLDREEVFVETKIWISDYGYDQTLHGFEKSARKLGVDQIDLLILHQALPSQFERRWTPTGRWRRCSPTARSARSGSATSWSTTSPAARAGHRGAGGQPDRGPPLLPAARGAGLRTPSTASSPRPGRRSAASPSTATASTPAPCRTRSSATSLRRTASRPRR